jgi:hypothetical protein
MNITAQVSVYPLGKPALDPPIQHTIARLQAAGLIAKSCSMSTVVAGEAAVAYLAKAPYTNSGCPTWQISMLKKAMEIERSGFWDHLRRSAFRHA